MSPHLAADTVETTLHFRCPAGNPCSPLNEYTADRFRRFNKAVVAAARRFGQEARVTEDELIFPTTLDLALDLARSLPNPAAEPSGFLADYLDAASPTDFLLGNFEGMLAVFEGLAEGFWKVMERPASPARPVPRRIPRGLVVAGLGAVALLIGAVVAAARSRV